MKPILLAIAAFSLAAPAAALQLRSSDIAEGKPLTLTQVYQGFGCSGGNLSPALSWSGAPEGTKSFAVTVYDPDAPTGSGWWHWIVFDLPASTNALSAGAAVKTKLPEGARQGRNDFGERNFGGACPPAGDRPHHYIFTIFALKTEKLSVPEDATAAHIGFMLRANALASAQMTAVYSR